MKTPTIPVTNAIGILRAYGIWKMLVRAASTPISTNPKKISVVKKRTIPRPSIRAISLGFLPASRCISVPTS